jgi:hypothetical protein
MATELREDVEKFAGRVLGQSLWPHQIEAVVVADAATQVGRSSRAALTRGFLSAARYVPRGDARIIERLRCGHSAAGW